MVINPDLKNTVAGEVDGQKVLWKDVDGRQLKTTTGRQPSRRACGLQAQISGMLIFSSVIPLK